MTSPEYLFLEAERMSSCNLPHHEGHSHVHGKGCGHTPVRHNGHVDYLHDGHLHHMHGDHVDEHD